VSCGRCDLIWQVTLRSFELDSCEEPLICLCLCVDNVDSIEANVETASVRVDEGIEQLQQARRSQVQFTCLHIMSCCYFMVCLSQMAGEVQTLRLWWRSIVGSGLDVYTGDCNYIFPPGPTQPGHPSMDRCNEYWRWLRPLLVKKQ